MNLANYFADDQETSRRVSNYEKKTNKNKIKSVISKFRSCQIWCQVKKKKKKKHLKDIYISKLKKKQNNNNNK